jgi:hypothetical protein
MKFNILKTRRGKLEAKLKAEIFNTILEEISMERILKAIDEYEKDNLETIEKLRRERSYDAKKINGAIKQFLHAHPVMTKLLIGSLTKRILGALTEPNKKKTLIQRFISWIRK